MTTSSLFPDRYNSTNNNTLPANAASQQGTTYIRNRFHNGQPTRYVTTDTSNNNHNEDSDTEIDVVNNEDYTNNVNGETNGNGNNNAYENNYNSRKIVSNNNISIRHLTSPITHPENSLILPALRNQSGPRNMLASTPLPHNNNNNNVKHMHQKRRHQSGFTASSLIESYYSRLGNDLQNLSVKSRKVSTNDMSLPVEQPESTLNPVDNNYPEDSNCMSEYEDTYGEERRPEQSNHSRHSAYFSNPIHTTQSRRSTQPDFYNQTNHALDTQRDQSVENVVSGPIRRPEVYGIRYPLQRQEFEAQNGINRHRAMQEAHEEWVERQKYRRTYNLGGFGMPRMPQYSPNPRIVPGMAVTSSHRFHTSRLLTRPQPIQVPVKRPQQSSQPSSTWVGLDGYRMLNPEGAWNNDKSKDDRSQRHGLGLTENGNEHEHEYESQHGHNRTPSTILGKRGPETRYGENQNEFGYPGDRNTLAESGEREENVGSTSSDASNNCDGTVADGRWPSNVRNWLQKWKFNDPEVCCVCFMETCNEDNPFVYCDEPECDVIIHQKCYGIDKCPGSEDTWRCDRCESLKVNRSKMVICALCPTSHGAFRKLEGPFFGLGWVHVACALWIPGVYIADPDQIKGINLRSVKPSCWKGKCAVCPDPVQAEYGACVSCQEPGCDTMFHVSCGQKYGLVRITVSGKRSICCYNHDKRERFKRARPEQRMNLWDRWVETRDEYLESADGETGAKKEFLSAWHKAYKDISHDNIESSSEAFSKFCDNINTICNTRYKEAKAIITEGKARLAKLYENIQRHSSSRDQTALQIELKAVMTRIQRASESNRRNKRYYDDILEQATRLSFQLVLKNNDKSKPVSVQPLVQNPVNSPSSVQLNFVAEVFSPDLSANKAQKAVPRNPKKKDSSRLNKALVASTLVGSDSIFNWVDASPDLESKKKSGTQTKPPKPTVTGNKKLTGKKALNVITADPQVKRRSKTKSTKGPKPPKTPKQAISKQTVNANQKKKAEKPSKAAERSFKTPEELDNCICGECNQHDLPQEALDRLKLPEDYMKRLEETVHLRLNGYTGKGLNWDPRVFIECSACKGEFHCGCPNPPIKNYPAPHEIFVCVHCDTTAEDLEESEAQRDLRDSANRTRVKARINYKE